VSDFVLQYVPNTMIHDIAIGQCTIHRASGSTAARWWLLWFSVRRDTDGQQELFCVPVNPGGGYLDSGPGGKTWGLTCPSSAHQPDTGRKDWQISPSINVLEDSRDAHPGPHPSGSAWHHTPEILNVPDGEPWANGAAP
jgi:hypothetical protein